MDQLSAPSRPSISDTPRPTHGPIPLFDAHLRLLADSYLSFFQERKRIEETYVESLLRLHRKSKALDNSLDDRGESSTARSVWSEIRDNIERDAQVREAFCNTLVVDVINPLTALKETQDRTRKRIKEDIKDSSYAYNDYAENVLPKLKSKYAKKFSEVEEQKRAVAAAPVTQLMASTEQTNQLSNSKSNPTFQTKPITAPQPLRALDRRPSGSGSTGRNRSPSSSTAFSDLAHQGKRQLNQLIGFLDKGGTVKESLGVRDNQALRSVRTKREAEEADKEYRKGIHWLETLRIRRTKILEAGYNSLEMFVEDLSATMKKVLVQYTDNLIATTTTQTQLATHARAILDKISSEKDVERIRAHIPRSLASAIPEPILYQHGHLGSCNDLIFGFSLVDYATTKGLHDGDIPKIVRICIQEIDRRGLEMEGIYRVSGRHANVQMLQHEIEKDESKFEFHPHRDDVYAVASLFKQYLRELPEPVFRFPLQDRIQHTEEFAEHKANNFALLRSKIRRLPPVHQATLRAIIEHLSRVASHSDKNKMDAKNLAIIFGSVIFGEDEMPRGGDLLSVQNWKDTLMEDLIANAPTLYDDQMYHHSPPLPPTPAGEPVPHYSYGSKNTRIASVPALGPVHQPRDSSPSTPPQDFTPKLPPRPANSIHPSSRSVPTSPSKKRPESRRESRPPPLPARPDNVSPSSTPLPSPSTTSSMYETDESPSLAHDDSEIPQESHPLTRPPHVSSLLTSQPDSGNSSATVHPVT